MDNFIIRKIMNNLTNTKINKIRDLMKKNQINFFILPLSDYHNSEYPCDYFKSLKFISGFTGSNGTLLISETESFLWTDGRYFAQCEKELKNSEIKLMKMAIPEYPSLLEFIEKNIKENQILGFDGKLFSYDIYSKIFKISQKNNFKIKNNIDFIDEIWKDRPSLPKEKAYILDETYTGMSFEKKIKSIRDIMKKNNSTIFILSSLGDIAWLFNLRGNDIKYNPFILSYSVITLNKVLLFVDISKIDDKVKRYLYTNSIEIFDYFEIYNYIKNISTNETILIDYQNTNSFIIESINKNIKVINKENPTILLKAIKNEIEIKNTIKAHIKDGVALTKFMYWLKNLKNERISEIDVVNKIEKFRKKDSSYLGNNFSTIAAFGKNSPMMHYLPTENSYSNIEKGNFLLVDTGGHYLWGSTDTTRTFAIGEITPQMKKHYTYVLKSLISLSKAKFPEGTLCGNLDTLARNIIWELTLDYRCATGHGVGYVGNVHEGPNILRGTSQVPIKKSMITTVEPGIYLENLYGIRLENEILTKEFCKNEYGCFLNFETITFVPFDFDAIDLKYLSNDEIEWLNNFNNNIFNTLRPFLEEKEVFWLKKFTKQI